MFGTGIGGVHMRSKITPSQAPTSHQTSRGARTVPLQCWYQYALLSFPRPTLHTKIVIYVSPLKNRTLLSRHLCLCFIFESVGALRGADQFCTSFHF
jgi:hypothetical protein